MRRLLFAALLSCSPSSPCDPVDPGETALLGTLHVGSELWRVQQAELTAHCSGVTTWRFLGTGTITLEPGFSRAAALHEVGHAILGPGHLDDEGAVMHARFPKSRDITPSDLAYCRIQDACSVAELPAPPPDGEPLAWAAARWDQITDDPVTFAAGESP